MLGLIDNPMATLSMSLIGNNLEVIPPFEAIFFSESGIFLETLSNIAPKELFSILS